MTTYEEDTVCPDKPPLFEDVTTWELVALLAFALGGFAFLMWGVRPLFAGAINVAEWIGIL